MNSVQFYLEHEFVMMISEALVWLTMEKFLCTILVFFVLYGKFVFVPSVRSKSNDNLSRTLLVTTPTSRLRTVGAG